MPFRTAQQLVELLQVRPAVDLPEIEEALGGASRATVFRLLRQVPYRRSFNYNGRFYALHDPARYDRHGLFFHGDIGFSRAGTLGATVERLVQEGPVGWTARELREVLRARVQPFLLAAIRTGVIARESLGVGYVYLSADSEVARAQMDHRREHVDGSRPGEGPVPDGVAVQVLLVLVRHPGCRAEDVARRLQGRSPPIDLLVVRAVFAQYELGKKGGSSTC